MSNESYKTMPRLFQVYVSEICLMSNERYKTMPQLFQVLMSEIRLVSNGKYRVMPRLFQVHVSGICLMSNGRYRILPRLFQVHVSEQGFHEEVPSPPSFSGEDPSLTRETVDNQLMLTEASLRKHTKAQELLYLQEASKEQPHLFHLKSRRTVGQRCRQKRIRSSGHEQTTDVFKFARNTKGQRGAGTSGGAGLFMSNFPITAVDVKVSHQCFGSE